MANKCRERVLGKFWVLLKLSMASITFSGRDWSRGTIRWVEAEGRRGGRGAVHECFAPFHKFSIFCTLLKATSNTLKVNQTCSKCSLWLTFSNYRHFVYSNLKVGFIPYYANEAKYKPPLVFQSKSSSISLFYKTRVHRCCTRVIFEMKRYLLVQPFDLFTRFIK